MQQLSVQLTIPIPEGQILIDKVELIDLQRQQLAGVSWSMPDLEARTGRKRDWLIENILFVPRFKNKIDSRNGGFVYYPENKGCPWAFQATKMAKFLDDNFHLIWGG